MKETIKIKRDLETRTELVGNGSGGDEVKLQTGFKDKDLI